MYTTTLGPFGLCPDLLFLIEFERSVPALLNVSPPYLGCEKILTLVISFIDKLKSSLVRPDLAVYGIRIG